jgi:tRNA nucleotidyltransferase/poly(A) polymerase
VGGYVRDWLLGRESHDLDFATAAAAAPIAREIADRFHGAFVLLDAEFDTARAVFKRGEESYDVDFARFRGPDIQADLADRDFTINALAIAAQELTHPKPPLMDPTGGQADLEAGLIRATSPEVFHDDPLRMLRAVRLSATLGFRIDPATQALIEQDASQLVGIAGERITAEVAQLLGQPQATPYLAYIRETGLAGAFLPILSALETRLAPPLGTAHDWALATVAAVEQILALIKDGTPSVALPSDALSPHREKLAEHLSALISESRNRTMLLKWCGWLYLLDYRKATPALKAILKPAAESVTARWLTRLRLSGQEVQRARKIVTFWPTVTGWLGQDALDRRILYRFFEALDTAGPETILLALASRLAAGDPEQEPQRWNRLLTLAERALAFYVEAWPEIKSLPPLVDGRDLIETLNLDPGPMVGQLLDGIREAQVAGALDTREKALAWAKAWLEGKS